MIIHIYNVLYSVYFSYCLGFNNMQTLKFKAQLTNAFFITLNEMFRGSSQVPDSTVHANQLVDCSSNNETVHRSSQ